MEQARELARRNIAAFEPGGSDYVVADAAGCGAALRDYPGWLAGDPGWAPAAGRFAARVRDVMELLAETPRPRSAHRPVTASDPRSRGLRSPDLAPNPRSPGAGTPRIAYDAPCHLLHAQRVDSAPRDAVRAMAGIEMESLESSTDCCGGAGLYNLFHTSLSNHILERKVEEIRAGAYEAVATGNPGCIMQIGAGLRAAGSRVPVVHPVQLLALEGVWADEA
jgi:glycolate oxidase iron-sulfur subunit